MVFVVFNTRNAHVICTPAWGAMSSLLSGSLTPPRNKSSSCSRAREAALTCVCVCGTLPRPQPGPGAPCSMCRSSRTRKRQTAVACSPRFPRSHRGGSFCARGVPRLGRSCCRALPGDPLLELLEPRHLLFPHVLELDFAFSGGLEGFEINVKLSVEVGSNVRAEGKHVIHLDIKLRLPPES